MKNAVCPYCEARFLYPDVKKRMKSRTGVCPNCGKPYRVSWRLTAVFLLCALAVLFALDFALLSVADMNLYFLMAVTVLGVSGAYLLVPFSVRFRKDADDCKTGGKAGRKAKNGIKA